MSESATEKKEEKISESATEKKEKMSESATEKKEEKMSESATEKKEKISESATDTKGKCGQTSRTNISNPSSNAGIHGATRRDNGGPGLPLTHILVFTAVSLSLVSLAPSIKETALSLFKSSYLMTAYMGDSILIGDSLTLLPFSDLEWTITQTPDYGDTRHTVSIFAVPEREAGRHIYLFKGNHTSPECFELKKNAISIGMRSYIYFLPSEYTKHSREYRGRGAYFQYKMEDCDDGENKVSTMTTYQFQSRAYFSDYLDNEPGARKRAVGCNCQVTDNVINKVCPHRSKTCMDDLHRDVGCFSNGCMGSLSGRFNATNSSYNFFTISASKGSRFRYSIDLEMFFYNVTKFAKRHYMCTIRGTDTCSFQKPAYSNYNPFKKERYLVIAYVHQTTVPGYFTTRLLVETKLNTNYVLNIAFLCGLMVFFIVKHCLQGICSTK